MYSFGVVLFELVIGLVPWAGLNVVQIITKVTVQRKSVADGADPPAGTPPQLRELASEVWPTIQQCWAATPPPRPSFADLHSRLLALYWGALRKGNVALRQVPEAFVCPITGDVIRDPVMLCDGHSYERQAIETWLQQAQRSPMTNEELESRTVVRNHALRAAIESLVALTASASQ